MMTEPKISIIMATYNRAHFIAETLQTIQNQTFSDFECLIIDDGGTDNTQEIIQPFLSNDNRFSYTKRPEKYTKGLPGCRNFGLDIAKGEYVIFFDDDDVVHPQNLECCLKILQKNSELDFCVYQKTVFTERFDYKFDKSFSFESSIVNVDVIEDVIRMKIPMSSCSVFWRMTCFSSHRFREELLYAEEWELYTRVISDEAQGISINRILYFARKHPNSNTGEFYSNNPVRRKSKSDAIILIVNNLVSKGLLTYSLLRYFIQLSDHFRDFKLFEQIIQVVKPNFFKKMYWIMFFALLPIRKPITQIKNKLLGKSRVIELPKL